MRNLTRILIMQAFRSYMKKHPETKVSITGLAKEIGVSQATLVRHEIPMFQLFTRIRDEIYCHNECVKAEQKRQKELSVFLRQRKSA